MVQLYKILKKTITINAIIVETTPASPTLATEIKGDFWKDHITSEVQNKMIIMGHQISSCHVPVVRSFFIL